MGLHRSLCFIVYRGYVVSSLFVLFLVASKVGIELQAACVSLVAVSEVAQRGRGCLLDMEPVVSCVGPGTV